MIIDIEIFPRSLSKREIHIVERELMKKHGMYRKWKLRVKDIFYFFYRKNKYLKPIEMTGKKYKVFKME